MKISVDITGCVGAGQCALVAPNLFDQDDDGIVILLDASPTSEQEALTRKAAALCPARVIKLED